LESEYYGPSQDPAGLEFPKSVTGFIFDKQARLNVILCLCMASGGFPAVLILEFHGDLTARVWIAVALVLSLLWVVCLILSKIRQEMYWDNTGLVLWNYWSRLSYKRTVVWSDLRSIEIVYLEGSDGEAYLKFYCKRRVLCSTVGDAALMRKVKESILIEQMKSKEGRESVATELHKRESVLTARRIAIKQASSPSSRYILTIFLAIVLIISSGFVYFKIFPNALYYSVPFAAAVVFLNYLSLQVYRFELTWDEKFYYLTTKFFGIPSIKKIERVKVQSIVSSQTLISESLTSCLKFDLVDSNEPVIFALRIEPPYARWIEETLWTVLKEVRPSGGVDQAAS
jgi:hypothetical protein